MIVLLLIIAFILLLVFVLRGEGSSYGKTNEYNSKSKINLSDKNYFL